MVGRSVYEQPIVIGRPVYAQPIVIGRPVYEQPIVIGRPVYEQPIVIGRPVYEQSIRELRNYRLGALAARCPGRRVGMVSPSAFITADTFSIRD